MKFNFLPLLSIPNKNALMTKGTFGYEWWYHSMIGYNEKTNESRAFFMEYCIMNPNKTDTTIPSYLMIKAGTYNKDPHEINNFYNLENVTIGKDSMEVILKNTSIYANEKKISGYVYLNSDIHNHIEWNLTANKVISYDLGYITTLCSYINIAEMYWHVAGVKTEYSGNIKYENENFIVKPESSCGYQDKNWGTDYTSKWVWLSCNNFIDNANTTLVIGGSKPKIFGIEFFETLIIYLNHNNKSYEFNFSKFWKVHNQKINIYKDNKYINYDIIVEDFENIIKIEFKCEISKMVKIKYQNARGKYEHRNLLNGHDAFGTLSIFDKKNNNIIFLKGLSAACEFGEKIYQ
jgi:tocopherol cyclase